jgi:hypothetical protein
MKKYKKIREFMRDLKRKSSFRSAIENVREAQENCVELEKTLKRKEERMKDCMECKYSEQCSAEMKDAHWYYTHSTLVDWRPYTFKICQYIIFHAFRKGFPHLTAGK